jgi:hypothetical protein
VRRWHRPEMRALRHARSCYGHLAGELGVRLHDALRSRGWVERLGGAERLTTAARAALQLQGLALPDLPNSAEGRALYPCVDWSERREHFAGAEAVALLEALLARGWLRRRETSRELCLTPVGQREFVDGLLAG